jgi:DNA repair exonuclease SbcCD ATPase subunit
MLELNHLTLENFMSISNMDLDLTNKITLISGENASGKSSIIDAISLCFVSKKRSTSYQDYVKQGKEYAKIILDCKINNKPVNFDIQLNLVKGTAFDITLTYDGKVYHNKETEDIIKSFGLDYYSDLIFTLQNEQDITSLTPAQRAYYLQKLLNFDFEDQKITLKKELEQFAEIIKINNIEIPQKEQSIKREQSSFETKKQITQTEDDILKFKEQIKNKETELLEAEKSVKTLAELNRKIAAINSQILEKQSSINDLKRQANSINEVINNRKKYEARLVELSGDTEDLTKKANELLNEVQNAEQLEREINGELNDIGDNRLTLLAIKHEIDKLQEMYDAELCPYCGQKTRDIAEDKFITYIQKQDLPEELTINVSTISECQINIIDKLAEYGNLIETKEKEREVISSELSKLNDKRIHYNVALDKLNHETLFVNQQLQGRIYNQSDIESIIKDITEEENIVTAITANKTNYENEIKKVSGVSISSINNELNSLRTVINNYSNTLLANEEIEKRNLQRKLNIVEIQKEIDELKNKNTEIIKQKDTYEEAYKIFDKDLPNFMSIKACAVLQENINDFIQNIFPNYEVSLQASKKGCEFFYTKNNTIKEGKKKNNYLINAKMSSGFEKALLTLAFKVSLAELYSCDCLILDEADGAANDDNAQLLYENLINENKFNQIFLITHKNTIKELVANNYNARVYEVENGSLI